MRLVGLSISLAPTFGCAASQPSEPEVAAAVPGAESTDPDSSEVSLAERAEELGSKVSDCGWPYRSSLSTRGWARSGRRAD